MHASKHSVHRAVTVSVLSHENTDSICLSDQSHRCPQEVKRESWYLFSLITRTPAVPVNMCSYLTYYMTSMSAFFQAAACTKTYWQPLSHCSGCVHRMWLLRTARDIFAACIYSFQRMYYRCISYIVHMLFYIILFYLLALLESFFRHGFNRKAQNIIIKCICSALTCW